MSKTFLEYYQRDMRIISGGYSRGYWYKVQKRRRLLCFTWWCTIIKTRDLPLAKQVYYDMLKGDEK